MNNKKRNRFRFYGNEDEALFQMRYKIWIFLFLNVSLIQSGEEERGVFVWSHPWKRGVLFSTVFDGSTTVLGRKLDVHFLNDKT